MREIRLDTGQSEYSALDLWQHLSKVPMVHHQPSASRKGMMTNEQRGKSPQKLSLQHVFRELERHHILVLCSPAYHKHAYQEHVQVDGPMVTSISRAYSSVRG